MLENENDRAEKRGTNEWMSDKSMPGKRAKVEMRAGVAGVGSRGVAAASPTPARAPMCVRDGVDRCSRKSCKAGR